MEVLLDKGVTERHVDRSDKPWQVMQHSRKVGVFFRVFFLSSPLLSSTLASSTSSSIGNSGPLTCMLLWLRQLQEQCLPSSPSACGAFVLISGDAHEK